MHEESGNQAFKFETIQSRSHSGFLSMTLGELALILLYTFILIENPLEAYIGGLRYFDEAIFLITFLYATVSKANGKRSIISGQSKILLYCFICILFGLCGNILNGYQKSAVAIISEIVSLLKFPLTTIACTSIFEKMRADRIVHGCAIVSQGFVLICFVCCMFNIISPNPMFSHDIRRGLTSFRFVYSHPTFLVFSLVMAYVMMMAEYRAFTVTKLACLYVLIMTLRDKAFGFVAFILVWQIVGASKKRNTLIYLSLAIIAVLCVAYPKVSQYLNYENSPRQALYTASIRMAVDSFPFGGGIGSIGSSLSGRYYSDAYLHYGIADMEGLRQYSYRDVGDAGFAYYLGQYGFVGSIFFFSAMTYLAKGLLQSSSSMVLRRNALIAMLGYLAIAMTVETVLTNATGACAAFVVALLASCGSADHN